MATATAEKPKEVSFWEAFITMQSELPTLSKSATNPYFSSRYVPLEQVIEVVRPIMAKHGFGYTQFPTVVEGQPALRTVIAHVSGQTISDTMLLMLKSPDPQGQGSAITYGRRYALMSILGIVGDEDDDGNKAQDKATETVSKKQQDELMMLVEQAGRTKEAYEKYIGHSIDQIKAADFESHQVKLQKIIEKQSADA